MKKFAWIVFGKSRFSYILEWIVMRLQIPRPGDRKPKLMNLNVKVIGFTLMGICTVSSCTQPDEHVQTALVRETVAEDLDKVYQHGEVAEALSLEDVLARALRYNLDTKVAELDELIAADDVTLEMLNSLPSVTGKIRRVGRSNEG